MPKHHRKRHNKVTYCLCIIDMQPRFKASQDPGTIQACLDRISQAMEEGAYIVIAQFKMFGKTDQRICDMVKGYRYVCYTHADQDDKSDAISRVLGKNRIKADDFRVCGVNLDACVYSTIYGLLDSFPGVTITLHEDACNSVCDKFYYRSTLISIKKLGVAIA